MIKKNYDKKIKVHSIKYNFIMNFILTASSFIFPLISFPYVSRVLGATANGKIAFATSLANYFLMVASLGIPTYGIRACAQVRDDREKLSQTVQEIFILNAVVTSGVIVTYILVIFFVPQLETYRVLLIINGFNILLNMFGMNWLYQALEQYDYITFRSMLFKILSVILMFAFVHAQSDYVIYAFISVFASVGSYVFNFIKVKQFVDLKKRDKYCLKRHVKPIIILFAQNIAVSIYTNLDTVMLGVIKNDTEVGYYNAAIKIKNVLLNLVCSLANVLLPRMSYYYKNAMLKKFRNTVAKAINISSMMALPIVAFFVVNASDCILFIAGNDYINAIPTMKTITFAIIPNGLTCILGVQILTAIGQEKYVLYSVVCGAIADIILNFLLIPNLGATGAAIATVLAETVVFIIQVIFAKEILRMLKKQLRFIKYIIASIVSVGVLFIPHSLKVESPFFSLVIKGIFFGSVYFICLVLLKDPIIKECIVKIKIKGDLIFEKLKSMNKKIK